VYKICFSGFVDIGFMIFQFCTVFHIYFDVLTASDTRGKQRGV